MATPENYTEGSVTYTCVFADDTTAKLTLNNLDFDNFNNNYVTSFKQKLREFNENPTVSNTMLSKAGAAWVGISGATAKKTVRQYYF